MNSAKANILDHYVSERAAQPIEGVQRDERYHRLRRRLQAEGFFEPAVWGYSWRISLFLGLLGGAVATLACAPSWPARIAAWTAIAFVMVQGAFISHEATHGSIFRGRGGIQWVGQFFNSFLVGFAFSYFWRGHTLHHAHCNEQAVDPDTHSSLFSLFESSAREKRGLGKIMTRFQHVLLPLLYPTWALVMKWDALTYVARNRKKTRLDQLALLLHLGFWFALPMLWLPFGAVLLNYVGWNALAGLYLGIVIPVSHVGRPPVTGEMPFLEQQLLVTRNLRSSWWMDFIFMGVNSHIEHHLFPQVPSSKLHLARRITREFCREEGLTYLEERYDGAVAEVLRHFLRMARLIRQS